MLNQLGYDVFTAATPGEAIRLAEEQAVKIHLLITDVVMPEMNCRDLADKLLVFYPELKCLFMSGYTANVITHHSVLDEGVNFIQKPFSIMALGDKVRRLWTRIKLKIAYRIKTLTAHNDACKGDDGGHGSGLFMEPVSREIFHCVQSIVGRDQSLIFKGERRSVS